jgi:hypothetical protein
VENPFIPKSFEGNEIVITMAHQPAVGRRWKNLLVSEHGNPWLMIAVHPPVPDLRRRRHRALDV